MRTQYELPGVVQAVDIVVWPDEQRVLQHTELGLVGRMLARPCMLECFHEPPGEDELSQCIARLVNLHAHLRRRPDELAGLMPAPDADSSALPWGSIHLWVVSAGRPDGLLDIMGCTPMDSRWGAGFWQAPAFLRTSIVVVRDLPEVRDTLLLRLLGAGRTLSRALQELAALPMGAWEAELAVPLVLAFRIEAAQNPDEEIMQHFAELDAIYERWERQTREEGRREGLEKGRTEGLQKGRTEGLERGRTEGLQKGRTEGLERGRTEGLEKGRQDSLRHSLRTVYRARFGQEPAALAAVLDAADVEALERWLPLFATGTADEIARSLQRESR